jgi:hypothetical protein
MTLQIVLRSTHPTELRNRSVSKKRRTSDVDTIMLCGVGIAGSENL